MPFCPIRRSLCARRMTGKLGEGLRASPYPGRRPDQWSALAARLYVQGVASLGVTTARQVSGRLPLSAFTPAALAEYERCAQIPGTATSMCEDYRAAASIDLVHDRADVQVGVKLMFEQDVSSDLDFPDADLIIASDGVNSRVRSHTPEIFKPDIVTRPNRFIWLGTNR